MRLLRKFPLLCRESPVKKGGGATQKSHDAPDAWVICVVTPRSIFNEAGEFSAFFGGKPYGIPSPIEQNNRHMLVMESIFKDDVVPLPRRLGIRMRPKLHGYVLVSKDARISRPKTKLDGLDCVLKVDQFATRLLQASEHEGLLTVAKLVSPDTLEAFGRQIAALHRPIEVNWAAKFGLSHQGAQPLPIRTVEEPELIEVLAGADELKRAADEPHVAPSTPADPREKSKLLCSGCGVRVSYTVAKFCWSTRRFGGKVYCRDCQQNR